MKQSAPLTLFNSERLLTKRYFRDGDTVRREFKGFASGAAQRIDVQTASELAHVLQNLAPTQCLAYGVTARLSASIGSQSHLKPGQIARTRENFAWADAPGVLFLDFDGAYDSGDVSRLRDALTAAMPELCGVAQVWTRSSSSGVHDPMTGVTSKGGLHCYVMVADARAIPALGAQLYDALWLHGHGFHILSRSESALERNLIDASVWQPERLDFAAAPVMKDGLERRGNTVIEVIDGEPLATRHVTPLSHASQAESDRLKRHSREQIKPAIVKARKAKLAALPEGEREARRAQYLAADQGALAPSHVLHFSDGRSVTAGEVLANLGMYKGQRLADPLEPDYANDSRIAMVADSGRIFSHAHGQRSFRILEDFTAPADVVALDPVPSEAAIVGACYRHRANAKADGIAAAVAETGADEEHLLAVWREHLKGKALANHRSGNYQSVGTFAEAREMLDTGKSGLFLAGLGTGKTDRLAKHVMQGARRGIAVTVLSSLTHSLAAKFDAVHYSEVKEMRDAATRLVTTVHSLHMQNMQGVDVLVLDEFAAIASLLSDSSAGRIMDAPEQRKTIDTLGRIARSGVQIVALDGDQTVTASWLAAELGLDAVEITEQPYADPRVALVAQEQAGGVSWHSKVTQLLAAGEQVVIATDGKGRAEQLARMFSDAKPLMIHGENSGKGPQAAFLANPEQEAKRHKLVIYTPVLGVGVSIVETSPHVFIHQHAGTLNAAGIWQLARRYRKPAGGVIHWAVSQNLCRPQRFGLSDRELMRDICSEAMALRMTDASVLGFHASEREQAMHDANPLHATIGHLLTLGVLDSIEVVGAESADEAKTAKQEVEAEGFKATSKAPRKSSDEVKALPRTDEAAAIRRRHRIEEGLALWEDGDLDVALVEQCEKDGLLSKVERAAALAMFKDGVDLEAGKERVDGFAYHLRTNVQCGLLLDMVADLTDENGQILLTGERAEMIALRYRSKIRVSYRWIPKPRANASRKHYAQWARDLLVSWGYAVERKAWRGKERQYFYAVADDVAEHVERVISVGKFRNVFSQKSA